MRAAIRRLRFLPLLLAAICFTSLRSSAQETPPVALRDLPAVKRLQREAMNEGDERIREAKERARERREAARRIAKARRRGARGEHVRLARREGEAFDETPARARVAPESPAPAPGLLALPANVRMNDPSADGASAGQSEVSVAVVGFYGLAGWNDGQGFVSAPNGQGVAYTIDGGATWHDVGLPPMTGTMTDWSSDPVIAVNEKTGTFYFGALTENGANNSGLAVVSATFPGGVFTWGTPHIVRDLPNSSDFLDKEWMVADSTTGNLYLTFTHFIVGGSSIGFLRSTDGGATWGSELSLSNNNGNVQASRPAVAGDGTLYVTWKELGPVDADFLMVRRSLDHGASFQPQNTAFSYYDNFGTGAAGFNRNRNVVEPCPVVDRSTGPHRGRLYAVLHESLNFYDDPIGGGGAKSEPKLTSTTEVNNNFFSRSVPFTPGQILRGEVRPSGDLDYWSFSATAGSSYIFYCDSLAFNLLYTLRIYCGADTFTRLAFSGDIDLQGGDASLVVWTAPTTGTYYLRVAHVAGGATFGGYHLFTGVANHGIEPGRDQRDVTLHYSDDGGATWSGAKRPNDELARYDDFLPEVGVSTEGFPYCAWYDFRDASTACFGQSHVYVSRSVDGGNTWAVNRRITTLPTAWTTAATNIAPNYGDYLGLYAGNVLALGWGDGRAGEADVNAWGATVSTDYTLACRGDTTVTPSTTVNVSLGVTNQNPVFAGSFDYSVTVDRAWTTSGPGSVVVAENGGSGSVPVSVTVPDTATGTAHVCVQVKLGARSTSCCFAITSQGAVGVGDGVAGGFGIHALTPNPAHRGLVVSFSLPSAAAARLELIDVNGSRRAAREVGALGAGRHTADFGRDISRLPAGMYAVRLVQGARSVTSMVSVLR